jgi:hypothetical protein
MYMVIMVWWYGMMAMRMVTILFELLLARLGHVQPREWRPHLQLLVLLPI